MDELTMRPIGVFHSRRRHPYEAPRQARDQRRDDGVIELLPGSQFEQALDSIESFERLWVIFWFHHNAHWKPMVRPPRGSDRKIGVFATRAPYRPNPLGLSCVRLISREGLQLHIEGSDLLDGTPILDLKPYLADADAFPEAGRGWLESIEDRRYEVLWSTEALERLTWLEGRGVHNLRDFTEEQLEFEPYDSDRKRVHRTENDVILAYRTWRVRFTEPTPGSLVIDTVFSGYSADDLKTPEDKWSDKDLHREFIAKFA